MPCVTNSILTLNNLSVLSLTLLQWAYKTPLKTSIINIIFNDFIRWKTETYPVYTIFYSTSCKCGKWHIYSERNTNKKWWHATSQHYIHYGRLRHGSHVKVKCSIIDYYYNGMKHEAVLKKRWKMEYFCLFKGFFYF